MATTITISGTSSTSNIILGSSNGKINSTGETITKESALEIMTPLKSKQYGIEILSKMWGYTGTQPTVISGSGVEPPLPFSWPNGTDISLSFYNPDAGSVTNKIIPTQGLIEHNCADFSTESGRRTDIYNIFYTQHEGSYFYLFAEISGNGPEFYHPNNYMRGGKKDGTQFNVMVLIRIPLSLDYFEGTCAHYNETIMQPTTQELVDYFIKYYKVVFQGASYPGSDPLVFYGMQLPSWSVFSEFANKNPLFGLKVNPTVEDILKLISIIATTGVEKSIWNRGSTLVTA